MSNNDNFPRAGLWLDLSSLARQTNEATYARALELYRAQSVLELNIEPQDDCWQVDGSVQGSQRKPYSVTIELSLDDKGRVEDWDSTCTCPVSSQCKHGLALLIKAAYHGKRILNNGHLPDRLPTLTPEERAQRQQAELERHQAFERAQSEKQLLQWFTALERSNERQAPQNAPGGPQGDAARSVRQENIVYLLSVPQFDGAKPQLHLEAALSYTKANGAWAKPKSLSGRILPGGQEFDKAGEVDQDALLLMGAMPSAHFVSKRYESNFRVAVQGRYGIALLEKVQSTGRLFLCDAKGMPGIAARRGGPRRVQWSWQELADSKWGDATWVLRARLERSAAKLCLNDPLMYLDLTSGEYGTAEAGGLSVPQVSTLLKAPALHVEALRKHQVVLAQRLGAVPLPPVLESVDLLSGLPLKARLHLRLTPADSIAEHGLVKAQLVFDYGGHTGWWAGQGPRVLVDAGDTASTPHAPKQCMLQRDPPAELEFMSQLMQWGLSGDGEGSFGLAGTAAQSLWLEWADTDYAALRKAGFEVTLSDALRDWISRADALTVQLQAKGPSQEHGVQDTEGDAAAHAGTSPWFDLSLGMEIDGKRLNVLPWLPELIAAAANSPRDLETGLPDIPPFIFLNRPGGGFIRLPTEGLKPWMAALLELVGHDFSGETLRLTRLDALRTAAALGEGAVWGGAHSLRTMVQQLSGRTHMPDVPVPPSLQATLRPYQQQGLNWLQFMRTYGLNGILADDMGLGKTLQTLAHIQVEKDAGRLTRPALIIAPVSLMGNWRSEAQRFCPTLRTIVIHGKDRHEVAADMAAHDIVIAPYSLLQRDKERWLDAQWHLVVLDEAQNIKNASTHAAQVAAQLQTQHRLCLSGTPMENHLGEIWSLFHFLMPGFLGSQKRFEELFRAPIEKLGDPERLQQLRARITPFMLRRTKSLVASELPPKVDTVVRVELEGKQADLYETIRLGMEKTVREALAARGLAKSQITILDALLKLRQVCCDPQLLKLPAAQKVRTSAKLEQLMEMLPEMVREGRRILLFSQFTTMLALIEVELKKNGLRWIKLTGQSQNREALVQQFTSGQVPIFLISLKAGGVGLNLPQADTVIHYDPWWNPAVENQATDRAHRIGQTGTVFVYKLVAQGTIEERILALQERKAQLAQSIYSGAAERKQPLFTESDLAELLRPLSQ